MGLTKVEELTYRESRPYGDETLKVGPWTGSSQTRSLRPTSRSLQISWRGAPFLNPVRHGCAFALLLATQDVSEGISSFLFKKDPEFKGE
jgi:hypothetical protein